MSAQFTRTGPAGGPSPVVTGGLSHALEKGRIGVWEWDSESNRLNIDPGLRGVLGYREHELGALPGELIQLIHPSDVARVESEVRTHLRAGTDTLQLTCRIRCNDGDFLCFRASATTTRDDAGRPLRIIGVLADVTDVRLAELASEESERKLNEATRIARLGSWSWHREDGRVAWTSESSTVLGPGILSGDWRPIEAIRRFVHPKDRRRILRWSAELLKREGPFELEFGVRVSGGEVRHILSRGEAFADTQGVVTRILGTAQDITQRKSQEEKIQRAKSEWEATFDAIPDWIALITPDRKILRTNLAVEEYAGMRVQDVIGRNVCEVNRHCGNPKDACIVERALRSRRREYIERRVPKTGRWVGVSVDPVQGKADGSVSLVHIVRDITDRRQAEERLKESRHFLDRILNGMYEGLLVVGTDYRIIEANRRFIADLGVPKEQVIGRKCYEVTHQSSTPCDLNDEACPLRFVLARGKPMRTRHLHRVVSSDPRVVEISAFPLFSNDRSVEGMVEILHDVTERDRAERALIASEEQFRTLVTQMGDGVIIADMDERVVFANPAAHRIFGVSTDALRGRSLVEFLDEDQAVILRSETDRRRRGDRSSYDLRIIRADHEERVLAVSAVPEVDADGNLMGTFGVFRDITDLKKAQADLVESRERLQNLADHLQSVREEERASFARELHDELGQALTVMKMDLSWLRKRLPEECTMLEGKVASTLGLVDRTIQVVKSICTALRPSLLDDLGLTAALEWQAAEFEDRTGIPCRLSVRGDEETLDMALVTAVFRIFQEALTNVARHAEASLVIADAALGPEEVELTVRDNGRGITEAQLGDPKAFGLIGMRERVHPWNGRVEIMGIAGEGTTVTVKIPIVCTGRTT